MNFLVIMYIIAMVLYKIYIPILTLEEQTYLYIQYITRPVCWVNVTQKTMHKFYSVLFVAYMYRSLFN